MLVMQIDLPDLQRQLAAEAKDIATYSPGKFLAVAATLIKNDLKKNMRAATSPDGTPYKPLKFPRPNGKSSPLWDTGALVRSVSSAGTDHVENISGATLTIGTNMEDAALHQYGGTIVLTQAQWLTIPITQKAKSAGGAKNFPGKLSFVPFGRGKAALRESRQPRGKRKGGGTKPITHYILVKKVVVPAREFLGFSDVVLKQIDDAYAKFVGAA
jgi:phage gpG-like protein